MALGCFGTSSSGQQLGLVLLLLPVPLTAPPTQHTQQQQAHSSS
jgi:hypothetical protein